MKDIEGYIKAVNIQTWKIEKIPKPKISIENDKIHDYIQEQGILRVEISPSELEKILSEAGGIPQEGISVLLPSPCGKLLYAKGVKKIEIAKPIYEDFGMN